MALKARWKLAGDLQVCIFIGTPRRGGGGLRPARGFTRFEAQLSDRRALLRSALLHIGGGPERI
jgi:hypothetical protein